MIRQVGIRFALGDDPFEVVLTSKAEQCFAVAVDVIAVE